MVLLTRLPERRNIGDKRYSVKMKRLLHKMPGSKVFSKDEVPLTRLPCARGAGPQSGPEGSFVDFRDKLSTLRSQFVYKTIPQLPFGRQPPLHKGALQLTTTPLPALTTFDPGTIYNYELYMGALTCSYMSAKICAQSST